MTISDFFLLIHPAIAIILVYPLIGIVVNRAWQTRQRRLQMIEGSKSKIPPIVGREHVQLGNWLGSAVVAVTLLGLAHPLGDKILADQMWEKNTSSLLLS